MLKSLKFFLERVQTCNRECDSRLGCVSRILTCPIRFLGWLFLQMARGLKFCERQLEEIMEGNKSESVYGTCPKCGGDVMARERRLNGDDICINSHKYPSKDTIPNKG